MQSDNGRLYYSSGIDNSELQRDAKKSKTILHGIGDTAQEEGQKIDDSMKKIGAAVAGIFAVEKLKEFATNVATVRGEFQQLEIAFETMLGNKQKADALMGQLIKTATTTPFGMTDIANSAKQLLAYGVAADEVNETLIRLGDIAAGLSIPINDLAYLYGTTMVQGRMYTQDLNQFLGRGIPIMEELAKQFGVTKSEVKDLVTEGKVGFENVKEAIEALTSEGSKFGGLMEKQSASITGQLSNIEDSIEQMFNEIGKSSEGAISGALSGVSTLIDNWQNIGKVLLVVISAYGTYKAAVLAVAAAHKVAAIWQEVQAFLSLTKSITSAKDAMLLLNMATKANPVGLVLAVVAAAVTAFIAFKNTTDEVADAIKREREEAEAFNRQVSESAGKTISSYKSLQKEYRALKGEHQKRQWIKDNAQSFNELGISVNSVTDAENIFVNNTAVILEAFKKRAEAAAWQSKVEAAYAKRVERQIELEQKRENIQAGTKASGSSHSTVGGLEYVDASGKWVYTEKGAEQARKQFDEANDDVIKQIDGEIDRFAEKVSDLTQGYQSLMKEGGTSPKTKDKSKNGKSDAQAIADETSERLEAIQKYRDEVKAQDRQAELDITQQKIELMEDGFEKQRLTIENHYERLINENVKREQQMLSALSDEKVNEWLNKNPKATKQQTNAYRESLGLTKADLTQEQKQTLEAYDRIAQEIRERELDSLYATNQQAMIDYLKQYGSYQEQKLAIATEYAEKIKAVQRSSDTEEQKTWKIASLRQEEASQSASLRADVLKNSIDWEGVFNDLSGHTKSYLESLRKQLQDILNEGSLPIDEMKTVSEKIQEINGFLSEQSSVWSYMGERAQEHRRLVDEAKAAQDRLNIAQSEETKAVGELMSIQMNVEAKGGKKNATSANLLDGLTKGSDEYKKMLPFVSQLSIAESKLAKAREKTIKATDDASNAEDKARRDSAQAVADWFADAQQFITDKGIDQIPDLLSSIGLSDAGGKIGKGLSGFNNAAGAAADLASQNYVGAALKAISAIKDFGSALGIGGGNKAEVIETTERLTSVNEALSKSIDKLKSSIDKNYGGKAISDFQDALKAQKEINENQRTILDAQQGYHSAHHSNASYWNMAQDSTDLVNQLLGTALSRNNWNEWSKLTAEQMEQIRTYLPKIWQEMLGQGKYDKSEYFEAYADQAGKIAELTEQIRQNLLDTSFEGLRDSFIDQLLDMDVAAEDFADGFSEKMQKALLRANISNKFDEDIKAWYESVTASMMDDSGNYIELSESQLEQYRQQWNAMTEQMIAERDRIAAITGYTGGTDSQREGASKGIATASQDSVDELNGRATAIQGHTYSIAENTRLLLTTTNSILRSVQNIEQDTGDISGRLSGMEANLRTVKETINDIALKGIKIK